MSSPLSVATRTQNAVFLVPSCSMQTPLSCSSQPRASRSLSSRQPPRRTAKGGKTRAETHYCTTGRGAKGRDAGDNDFPPTRVRRHPIHPGRHPNGGSESREQHLFAAAANHRIGHPTLETTDGEDRLATRGIYLLSPLRSPPVS